MKVVFACPQCGAPAQARLDSPSDWQCAACRHPLHVHAPDPALATCRICGNHELYKKKDFPHGLGMAILVLACALSLVTYNWYEKWLTWAILIGTAAFDGVLYLLVGDAIVCYRCNAHYHGFQATTEHQPHELTIGERYRQERLRREQLKTGRP
ncbi:MAG: hypothetical protein L0Y71_10865 [Gemmataceae bacterium]|nr:hypothetical protein [Gemmataceae bacterium]